MGRGCITYSISFLVGILFAEIVSPHFTFTAILVAALFPLCIIFRKNTLKFILFSHLALFFAGIGGYSISKEKKNYPKSQLITNITSKSEAIQQHTSSLLYKLTPNPNSHAILGALTIGDKKKISPDLKEAYSSAGAIHILALSGLHVGIMYSIVQTLLYPLKLFRAMRWITDIVSILLILLYAVISGCSPSVVRAGTMIVIYSIGRTTFRDVGKWDAIALSALISGAISPIQVNSLGFQLSYAAVIGIAMLYPTCCQSFRRITGTILRQTSLIYRILQKIWESISISVCCQIATLPILLFHFGESAQFFLITNLVAIPLATAILYTFTAALLLQWIPYANQLSTDLLNILIEFLNTSIIYISN